LYLFSHYFRALFFFNNRTEKRAMEAYVQSLCQEADDRLTKFVDRLHLECLDMYKNYSNEYENDENNIKNELPQVSSYFSS
jgi:hypothetical protein